ncbi:MAG TPA: glycosyltransferase [Ignavibacteriaceae bacterium]|nr:glycosyltransferase [Ignavibacteriaceae bacterium]
MISIVTITYNDFNGLKRTLSSIPDYDFIESVVINGGTNKATIDFLSSHKGKIINEKDEGIADAFNKGITNSSGNAVMFLNSGDELIEPVYLKESEQIFKTNKEVAFVHSNLILIDSIGTELYMKPPFCNLGRGLPYLHPTMIVRKSAFDQIGLFNKNYKIAMDFDFIVRLERKGYKGFYLNDKAMVKMEGTGRSVEQEFDGIKECYKSLKQNDFLNLENSFGMMVRVVLFFLRKLMILIGLGGLLRNLKKQKHSAKRIVKV